MKLGVYSLFDSVGENFGSLSLDKSDIVARRNFASAMAESTQLQFIAKDLVLYRIADFDSDTGVLIPCVPMVQVVKGLEVMPSV